MARILGDPSGAVTVRFDSQDVAQTAELALAALESSEAAIRTGMIPWNHNTSNSQLTGKLGEYVVEASFQKCGVLESSTFREPALNGSPDLIAMGHAVELKTWSPNGWGTWGRCVSPGQLPGMAGRATYSVWVVVCEGVNAAVATDHGWPTPAEVATCRTCRNGLSCRPVQNHQFFRTRSPTGHVPADSALTFEHSLMCTTHSGGSS